MKYQRFLVGLGLLLAVAISLPGSAGAEDVRLQDVSFQAVVDELFGTAGTTGLLASDKQFQLHADNIILTSDQAKAFFVPTTENPADFADLIKAAEGIRGVELKVSGLLDGAPFDLKLSGKQVKLEGIVLTDAELDALIEQLQATPGLHEAKIEALVDGKIVQVKLENVAGRVKIEDRDREHHDALGESRSRGRDARLEGIERERPERVEKIERPEKPERIERPERGGPGR